jgi:hypothetical protein
MITVINAYHTMTEKFPVTILPNGAMIQHLGGAWEGGAAVLCEPFSIGYPTHFRVHITDHERIAERHAAFRFRHLKALTHSHGFRNWTP